jgi:hypothetical protein
MRPNKNQPPRRKDEPTLILLDNVGCNFDWDAATYTGRRRTLLLVRRKSALGGFAFSGRNPYFVADAYPRDPKDTVDCLNIPLNVRTKLVRLGGNLAHLQRARKRAEQSTGNGGNHVVESRRHLFCRLYTVEFLDSAMNAISDGFTKMLDVCVSNRTFYLFDTNVTGVN